MFAMKQQSKTQSKSNLLANSIHSTQRVTYDSIIGKVTAHEVGFNALTRVLSKVHMHVVLKSRWLCSEPVQK